jgi:hypothetical protein
MYGTSPSLRSVMVDNGDGAKQIWATEFGAPTDGPAGSHVSEGSQANMIADAYDTWSTYDWGGPLFAYQGRDLGTNTNTRENFFGLLHNDFTEKPAYEAYKSAASDPASPGDRATTTTSLRGSGNGHGGGHVKGRVRSAAGSWKELTSGGRTRVGLTLYRRHHTVWHQASHRHTIRVGVQGRFHARLHALHRHLHPGVYRVRARYLGSQGTRPSASTSRPFRLRG